MRDRLKEYMEDNHDAFDTIEVPKATWDKIENSLHGGKNRRISIIKYASIVSAASIVLFVIYFALGNKVTSSETVANNGLSETELYYSNKVNQKRAQVYTMSTNYPELKTEMDNDLAELDTIMLELKKDLDDNVDNAEVIDAMIQNYRLKLVILEDIMAFLEQHEDDSNKPKRTSYEL